LSIAPAGVATAGYNEWTGMGRKVGPLLTS